MTMETLCKQYLELANVVPDTCISSREYALIEKCAQIAEAHYARYCGQRIDAIAAAIRALKDKQP